MQARNAVALITLINKTCILTRTRAYRFQSVPNLNYFVESSVNYLGLVYVA